MGLTRFAGHLGGRGEPSSNPDTDNDGLPDAWEIAYIGDLSQDGGDDGDQDGLNNGGEFQAGAIPSEPDTDGDTLSDGDEVWNYVSSPTVADTDEDWINDNEEINRDFGYFTDPQNPDTDSDGYTDGQEISDYVTDPTDANSHP